MVLFVVSGLRGRDFGHHWDEVEWQLMPVRRMVERGHWMPPAEIYPGMARWLVLIPALPAGLVGLLRGEGFRSATAAKLALPDYLLDARSCFIVVSALAILWVYLAARAFGRPRWEATVAAAGLGLSWEYAYHARWLATDCIVVEFTALMLYLLARFRRDGNTWFLYAAAASAGLATGTKYPAGLLLAPVWLASAFSLPFSKLREQAQRIVLLGAVALGAYLVTSPSTLFDAAKFAEKMHFIQGSYARANAGYGVASTREHLVVVAKYFALAYFSPYRVLAVLGFACMLLGVFGTWQSDRRLAWLLGAMPVVFLVVIGIRYRTVVVRNYLLLTPFLSIFMARGVASVGAWMRERAFPAKRQRGGEAGRIFVWLGAAVLVVIGAVHAAWLVAAGESIRRASPESEVREAYEYVAAHPRLIFRLSPRVKEIGERLGLRTPPNTNDDSAGAIVLFAEAE